MFDMLSYSYYIPIILLHRQCLTCVAAAWGTSV